MIEFLYPWGLASLASLGGILFLYLYQFRGRRVEVSALFLWRTEGSAHREGRQRRRIPWTLPLLLELLAALLLSLAVAGLAYSRSVSRPRAVVLLDSSASMNAGSGDRSFRQRAAQKVSRIFDEMGQRGRVTLVETGFGGRLMGDELLARREAMQLLSDWRPGAPPHSFQPALQLARSLAGDEASIVLLTDHRAGVEGADVVGVGRIQPNTGWLNARWQGGNEIFALARHYGAEAGKKTVVVADGEEVLARRELDFAERRSMPLTVEVPEGVSSVELRLPDDALPDDNVVHLARPSQPVVPVEVAVSGSALKDRIWKALRSVPDLAVADSDDPALSFRGEDDGTDGALLEVTFHVPSEEDREVFSGPYFVEPYHALTRGLSLKGALWAADAGYNPDSGRVLASVGSVPLLVLQGDRLVVNLDPGAEQASIFRMAAWPVLVSNVMNWTHERMPGLKRHSFRPGERVSFEKPADWPSPVAVEVPGGTQESFTGRRIRVGTLERTGIYRMRAGGEVVARFHVNLLSADESDLTSAAAFGSVEGAAQATVAGEGRSFFHQELAALAAFLLLGCWFLLNRYRT
ncbi:MAG: VWA domain-containing protein [Planctomycetota bacterium]